MVVAIEGEARRLRGGGLHFYGIHTGVRPQPKGKDFVRVRTAVSPANGFPFSP